MPNISKAQAIDNLISLVRLRGYQSLTIEGSVAIPKDAALDLLAELLEVALAVADAHDDEQKEPFAHHGMEPPIGSDLELLMPQD